MESKDKFKIDTSYFATGVPTCEGHVRTRMYFTSESHIHAVINAFKYGLKDNSEEWQKSLKILDNISELNYLSQILILVWVGAGS